FGAADGWTAASAATSGGRGVAANGSAIATESAGADPVCRAPNALAGSAGVTAGGAAGNLSRGGPAGRPPEPVVESRVTTASSGRVTASGASSVTGTGEGAAGG